MTIKRGQIGCLFVILLSFLALQQVVFGARHLQDKLDDVEKPDNMGTSRSTKDEYQGFVATIKREVPSGPDPLHNR